MPEVKFLESMKSGLIRICIEGSNNIDLVRENLEICKIGLQWPRIFRNVFTMALNQKI